MGRRLLMYDIYVLLSEILIHDRYIYVALKYENNRRALLLEN